MKFEIYVYAPEKIPSFYKKAIGEYEKRLSRYGKITLHVLRKEKTWKKLLEDADYGYYITAGTSTSSEEFSKSIADWENKRCKEISFFVDDHYGGTVPADKFLPFSISDFRINGIMTTMILYEQIYRGYRIIHNHPYHK